MIKDNVPKEEAEKMKKTLEASGATVVLAWGPQQIIKYGMVMGLFYKKEQRTRVGYKLPVFLDFKCPIPFKMAVVVIVNEPALYFVRSTSKHSSGRFFDRKLFGV